MNKQGKIPDLFPSAIEEATALLKQVLIDRELLETGRRVAERIVKAYRMGCKVLICGNGGSAADAQHMAAELSGRFLFDRQPLSAEALHVNTSYLTAVANDYSYEETFARLIRAQGRPGDVLIALSTSGRSKNVLRALEEANAAGMVTVGFTGRRPNPMEQLCDHLLSIPSGMTPRIQECHIILGHILCETVENVLFSVQRPVVFLDRDGVINRKMPEGEYVREWDQFSFLPDVFEAIRVFNDHGYLVIVVTNQQCVGKGIVSAETVDLIHEAMAGSIEKNGAHIDAVYVCPHLAAQECPCRKPATGLFDKAVMDFRRQGISIDLSASYMIGDSDTDVLAGKRAGLTTVRLTSNYDPRSCTEGTGILEAARKVVQDAGGTRVAM